MVKKEWCIEKAIILNCAGTELKPNKYFRCPRCKKRFTTYIRNCTGDLDFKQACCWYEYLPPHKKRAGSSDG